MQFDNSTEVITPDLTTILTIGGTALELPHGPSATRPLTADGGAIRFNTNNNWFEGFNGTDWFALSGSPSASYFDVAYTITGTLSTPPIATLTPPPPAVDGLVADYSGTWASMVILASTNSALTAITFTNLQGLTGSLVINSMPALTGLSMPALTTILGAFSVTNMATLTTLGFPNLTRVDGRFNPGDMQTVAALSFPTLETTGDFAPHTMPALASLSAASLSVVTGDFEPNTMSTLSLLSCPDLTTVVGNFQPNTMSALPALNVQSLVSVGGFFPNTMAALATLSCTSLTTVVGNFNAHTMAALPLLRLPALSTVGGDVIASAMAALTTINLSSLITCGGRIILSDMVAFTTLDLSAIVRIGTNITAGNVISITAGTAAMTTISLSGSLKQVGNGAGNVMVTSAVLDTASVNNLLIRLAALDGSNGTSVFSNRTVIITGTSATPGATGLTAKATLESRGCTVTTN